MSWTDTSYTSQPYPLPPRTHARTHTHTHTHTHTLPSLTSLSLSLFPSLLLQYTLCQQKNKREGKAREAGGESEKGVKEEGGKKKTETGEIRLSPGLAKGQSWQARRLNCRVKILFIILCSLFPNSPLLCHSQCPASMFPTPGFIRHCWAARKGTFSVQ